ncbi:unnamed protein product [Pedinophyceae sp. YPF-701]|nr:unnamed protein product [Pedinophyceae sp. YPF-701]
MSVYLDVAAGSVDDLLRYLRRHKLRSRVDLHDLTSHKVVAAAWPGAGAPPAAWAASLPGDPRVAALGRRGIIEAGAAPAPDDDDNAAAERVYKYVRALCGVAEGPAEIPPGEALPLEFNMDGMAGVSYTKGCYVGQELTARTHYTGVVRKRVVPIALDGDGAEVAPGAKVYAEGSKRAAGKILATCAAPAGAGGAVGLALLRLAAVLPADAPPLVVEGGGVAVRATRPEWWPAEWGHEEDDAQQAGQAV